MDPDAHCVHKGAAHGYQRHERHRVPVVGNVMMAEVEPYPQLLVQGRVALHGPVADEAE